MEKEYFENEAAMEQEKKTERSVEDWILGDLGLTWEDLQNKKVLDVGAGLGELAREGKKHGVEIVSLDTLEGGDHSEDGGRPQKDIPFVVGDAAQMPFADDSFDMIVSHAAPPVLSGGSGEERAVLNEARRVLKEGGEFRFGPGHVLISAKEAEEAPENMKEKTAWFGEKSLGKMQHMGWEGEMKYRSDSDKDDPRNYYVLRKKEHENG